MQKITLYRYVRADGGVTVSPVKPDGEYTELFRLASDEGMVLTDGKQYVSCVDTDAPYAWTEVVDTETDEATEADYLNALNELGVNTDEESNA